MLSPGGGMIMTIVLSVVFAFAAISLAWRLLSDRRAWRPQLVRLQFEIDSRQFKIDLAKRLLERDFDRSRDIGWQMWSGTPEQQQSLAEFLDHQAALEESEAENIDPLPPP
jgi:hypothetical protein